jgi:hypothetical protein
MGRRVREVTTYERDNDGRIIRSTAVRDAEWTDEDRGWVLALLAEEADTCPGCGQPNSVCRDPKTMYEWRAVQVQCQACRMIETQRESDADGPKRRGIYTGVRRIPPDSG